MSKKNSIIVGIILYNPNLDRLEKNISAIIDSADSILLIDNASKNIIDIQNFAAKRAIQLIINHENQGLPKAFNTMIDYARSNHFENLLLLDQDSICDKNLINKYKENISSDYACLTPRIIHRLKEYEEKYGSKTNPLEKEIISDSINSGTLINLTILPPNIRFNEKLFVDCVDFDFFIQLQERKLKVVRLNSTYLICDLGNLEVHYILHKSFFSNNYSTFRLEKQAKDRIVFIFTHFTNRLAKEVFCHSLLGYLMIILFEKQKIPKLFAVSNGFIKGIITLLH